MPLINFITPLIKKIHTVVMNCYYRRGLKVRRDIKNVIVQVVMLSSVKRSNSPQKSSQRVGLSQSLYKIYESFS